MNGRKKSGGSFGLLFWAIVVILVCRVLVVLVDTGIMPILLIVLALIAIGYIVSIFFRRKNENKENNDIINNKVSVESSNIERSHDIASSEKHRYAWEEKIDRKNELMKQYKSILEKHGKLREQIGIQYTVAREKNGFDSKEMEAVVDLCKKDIDLAGDVMEYYHRSESVNGVHVDPSAYMDTFQRLAIIYEKQGKYDEAIEVCKQAIQYGILRDGTQGGMQGRIARIMSKKKKVN